MTTTTANAVDEMLAVVKAALDAAYPGLHVRWPGVLHSAPAPAEAPWVRVEVLHRAGFQRALGGSGRRRWGRTGELWVQCFAPLKSGGLNDAQDMACAVRDAMQGSSTPGGVWLRNATTNEVGPDASWYHVNAMAEFHYDEVTQ
jgi:hypothetical protein